MLRDTIAEIASRIADVDLSEGKDRDRRTVPRPKPGSFRNRADARRVLAQPVDPDGVGKVLQFHLSEGVPFEFELVRDMVICDAGDADTPGFSQALDSRGDVDRIAIDALAVDQHFAEV